MNATICIIILIVLGSISIGFIVYKNNIVIQLDQRYYDVKIIRDATLKYLRFCGKKCKVIDNTTLLIDGEKYCLKEQTINIDGTPQQIVLKKVRKNFF